MQQDCDAHQRRDAEQTLSFHAVVAFPKLGRSNRGHAGRWILVLGQFRLESKQKEAQTYAHYHHFPHGDARDPLGRCWHQVM